jgi:hypothetical protein
MASSAHHGR